MTGTSGVAGLPAATGTQPQGYSSGMAGSSGITGTTSTPGMTGATGGSTSQGYSSGMTSSSATGPHGSNLLNKLDPRVDSDGDGRRGVESGRTGTSSTGLGSTRAGGDTSAAIAGAHGLTGGSLVHDAITIDDPSRDHHHGHHESGGLTGRTDTTGGALSGRYNEPGLSSNTSGMTGMGSGTSGLRDTTGTMDNRYGQDTMGSGTGAIGGTGMSGQRTTGFGDSTGTTGGALSGRYNEPGLSSNTSGMAGMGSGSSGLRDTTGTMDNRYGQDSLGSGTGAIGGSGYRDPYNDNTSGEFAHI